MVLIREVIQQEIINKMNDRLVPTFVGSVVDGEQYLEFESLKWIKLKRDTINGLRFELIEDGVKFKGVTEPFTMDSDIRLGKPLFMDGTLSNTKFEWSRFESNEKKKLPFIWLVSPTTQKQKSLETDNISVDAQLWFVGGSDWSKLNIDRQHEAIKPLTVLKHYFMLAMSRNPLFYDVENMISRDFPKFGTETKDGIEKEVFPSKLSAIEANISFGLLNCCKFGENY